MFDPSIIWVQWLIAEEKARQEKAKANEREFKMIDIKSYQEGFMDGVGCKDNYKIHLLGYDLTELLKIVDDYAMRKHEMQVSTKQEIFNTYGLTLEDLVEAQNRKYSPMPTKAKMTRAEAIKVMEKHLPFSNNVEKVIDFYVEAGMLDIVEEEKLPVFEIILNNLDQTHIKIYENGKVEGISGTIINRMRSRK